VEKVMEIGRINMGNRSQAPVAETSDRRRTIDDRVANYRYGLLLGLLFVTFFFVGTTSPSRWSPLVTVVVESATLLVALLASGAKRLVVIGSMVVIASGLTVSTIEIFSPSQTGATAAAGVAALLVFVAPITIVRGLVARHTLDLKTVLGALCLYVMLGLFFAFLFNAIEVAGGDPFFAQIHRGTPSDFLYFSVVTMTTVGYGDLTAASGLGRSVAVFEAMVGQLYLVTVVALLVSNLGPIVSRRRQGHGGDTP